ncbi:hypothetical protein G6F56_005304 [Rhizopus delemar]|nr:hypothetical protein G6F56_005304 [Rhizopus delemar]
MAYNYDVAGLDSLVFETPCLQTEKEGSGELDLWINAQFTFDVKPGSGIYDEEKPKSPTPSQLQCSGLDPVTYDTLANYLDYELPKQQLEKAPLKRIQPRPLAPAPALLTRQVLLPKPTPVSPVSPVLHDKCAKRALESDEEVFGVDKRRRNTAASARFRVKKKLREQAVEQSVREMTIKSDKLQERVDYLESEIQFLRSLLLDKSASNKP